MIAQLSPYTRDERGASIIELALVAPVLASMLVGMVDLSRAYSYKLKLEQAAQRAIEKVQAVSNVVEHLQHASDRGGYRRRRA